jgi:hypothetical protein
LPRISIGTALWLVVMAALNFAVLRAFASIQKGPLLIVLLVGLMPLFDGFIISAYCAATKRFHFTLKRRESLGDFAGFFAIMSAVLMAASTVMCVVATEQVFQLVEALFGAFKDWFGVLSHQPRYEALVGSILCLIMSGPMLLIATGFAWTMSRYRLVMTPRVVADQP